MGRWEALNMSMVGGTIRNVTPPNASKVRALEIYGNSFSTVILFNQE
jgi:hypothetical protein